MQDKWKYPPFSATIDEQDNIYGRGAQDTKCIAIQYIEAIKRMKLNGQRFNRTLHMSFVPEEELGGIHGMKDFIKTADFKALNIGFSLDEGMASSTETFNLYNNEKTLWQMRIKCRGNAGHGSYLIPNTAGEKIRIIIDRFMDFRANEATKLAAGNHQLGDVVSINLTKLQV